VAKSGASGAETSSIEIGAEPGTWVTNQTGNMGDIFRVFAGMVAHALGASPGLESPGRPEAKPRTDGVKAPSNAGEQQHRQGRASPMRGAATL
jgi:hypothetical protein